MGDEEAGFTVSLRDVYDEVRAIGQQLGSYVAAQAPVIAVIEHRLGGHDAAFTELRSDIAEIQRAREAEQLRREQDHTTSRRDRLQARAAIVGAVLAAVLAVVLPLLIHTH